MYVGGKRLRKSLKTSDRKLALAKARALERTQVPGDHNRDRLLSDFKEEYLLFIAPRKAPSSIAADRYALERLLKFMDGAYINQITVREADAFVSHLASEIKPISTNFYLRALRAIFETARRWKYISENVFRQIKMLTYELPQPRILSIKEIRLFMKTMKAEHPHLAPLMEFYLLTGARRAEAMRLTWEDVDFESNTVSFKKTKGKRPRTIPMIGRVRKVLQARRELERPFTFKEDYVTRKVGEVIKQCGIQGATLHDLRKSFASYLADAGMPDFFITILIGHQDRETTQRHYIGHFDEMIRKYMDKIERTIFQ